MKLKCIIPFTYLEFDPGGWVHICCPAWTKAGPVGNILAQSFAQTWNSQKAQYVRKCLYRGNLRPICNEKYCPEYLSNRNLTPEEWQKKESLPHKLVSELKEEKTRLSSLPINVEIADSGECNLRCKMCISNESFNSTNKKLTQKIFDKVLPSLLPHIKILTFSGNGEVFYRKETRDFLQNFNPKRYPGLRFNLLSNGLLLTSSLWQKIKHNQFNAISISIDAATPQTYRKIRGGNWQTLQKNLKMISRLRRQGRFRWFQVNFVVMKSNYREMADFAEMGLKLGVDCVQFAKIFGRTPNCLEENFNLANNSRIIDEIKSMLRKPVFSKPQIDTRQLSSYRKYQPNLWERSGVKQAAVNTFKPIYQFYWQIPASFRPIKKLKGLSRRLLDNLHN